MSLTVDKDLCVPRLPSYILKKKTADRPVQFLSCEDLPDSDFSRYGLVGSPTSVTRMFAPPARDSQVCLEGPDKALALFQILTDKKIL